MALEGQIDRALTGDKPVIGFDGMHRDAILAMPATERADAILELERARRCVIRLAADHADEILPMLGMPPRTELERALAPRPQPKTTPPPQAATKPPRSRARAGQATHKQCTRCHGIKPVAEFDGRSYRCRACTRKALTALERERVRDFDRLAAEAFPAGSAQLVNARKDKDNA